MTKHSDDFNLAGAMREALEENPNYTGPECRKWIESHYPNAKPKDTSVQVAYSKQRRKLGLLLPRRPLDSSNLVDVLTAAKELISLCDGDENKAHEAISAIEMLSH